MDVYDLDTQQLPRLYRVQYDESQTTYEIGTGLKAQDTDTFYDAWYDMFVDFGGAVEQHLNWDHNYTSIFISLFSEKRHAENWLLDRHSKRDCGNCTLLEIDATQLGHVYEAQELVESLSLIVPEKAKASISKEYLVAHHITPRAIIRRITLDEIKQDFSSGVAVIWRSNWTSKERAVWESDGKPSSPFISRSNCRILLTIN